MHFLVICTALWSVAALAFSAEVCSEGKIESCLSLMQDYEGVIVQAVVPTMTEEQMKEHCRLYQLFYDCMDPFRHSCSTLNILIYEGVDDAYHFMCDEAFDEYLQYAKCFQDPELHREGEYCNATMERQLTDLGYYGRNRTDRNEYTKSKICQYATQYLYCVETAVSAACGQDAGAWQRTLDTKSLAPLLDEIGCPGFSYGYGEAMWIYIVVGVLLAISVVIIIVSVVMIVMAKKRKRRRPRRAQDLPTQVVPGAPPAYDGPYVNYAPDQGHVQVQGVGAAGAVGMEGPGGQAGPLPDKSSMLPPPYEVSPVSAPLAPATHLAAAPQAIGYHSGTTSLDLAPAPRIATISPGLPPTAADYQTGMASGLRDAIDPSEYFTGPSERELTMEDDRHSYTRSADNSSGIPSDKVPIV